MQPGCRTFTIKCGYNHYKVLMEKFPLVVHVFLSLEPQVSVEGSQNLPKESTRGVDGPLSTGRCCGSAPINGCG